MSTRLNQVELDDSDAEAVWKVFKLGIQASAAECCGTKYIGPAPNGKVRTHWWTQEVQELVKGKKRAFREWLNIKSSTFRQLYTNTRKVAAEAVKKAKEES